jgi:hypothetical protein
MNRNFLRIITAAFLFSGLGDWAIAQSPGPQGRPVYNIMDLERTMTAPEMPRMRSARPLRR